MSETRSTQNEIVKPKFILFDVYETLLNTRPVRSKINDSLQNKKAYRIWVELWMQHALVDIVTGHFHSFTEHSYESLRSASELFGQPFDATLNDEIIHLMKHAPLHEDVQESLSALSNDGYRLGALSNISSKVLHERMEGTGLVSYFEFVLSAEDLRSYKPSPEAYANAIKKSEVKPSEILMVTAHWWDIRGAAAAGLQTAYLSRNNSGEGSWPTDPLFTLEDTSALVEKLRSEFSNDAG